jgi:tetratricopeptide (TPR) repeat protein
LKTIKRAFEASLEKEDPISTTEMLMTYASKVSLIFEESPLSILKMFDINKNNNEIDDVIEGTLRLANLYDTDTFIMWYLLIAWYLNGNDKRYYAKKTLDSLFKKKLDPISKGQDIIIFLIYNLYECHKETLAKIFDYLSNNDIYKIFELFIKSKKWLLGLDIFRYIKTKKIYTSKEIKEIKDSKSKIEDLSLDEIIEKCHNLSNHSYSKAVASIALSLSQSNRIDEAIHFVMKIKDYADVSQFLFSIASSLAQSNRIDDVVLIFDTIADTQIGSTALSFFASSLAQSNRIDEAIQVAKAICDSSLRSQVLVSIAYTLVQSNRIDESLKLFIEAIRVTKDIDDFHDEIQIPESISFKLYRTYGLNYIIKVVKELDSDYRLKTLSDIVS